MSVFIEILKAALQFFYPEIAALKFSLVWWYTDLQ